MHLQQTSSSGPVLDAPVHHQEEDLPLKTFSHKSSSLPFGQHISLSSISGSSYLTAQSLVQQVAYTLSDKIFTYSPETFDLDLALRHWMNEREKNAFGYVPGLHTMEIRAGAGSIALGYIFSPDFDLQKRHIPQTVVASSAGLVHLRPILEQLSLLHALANPFVAHIAAVDYTSSGLVPDYTPALAVADALGLGLVSSASADEVQHMSLFATVLAKQIPTIHVYDGVTVNRQTSMMRNVLGQKTLGKVYQATLDALSPTDLKHSDNEGKLVRILNAFNQELGTNYGLFEYYGHDAPEAVLVVFGTVEASLSRQVAEALSNQGQSVGVINVRAYRPFVEEEFLRVLPQSVHSIGVVGQVDSELAAADNDHHSSLYQDVLATLTFLFPPQDYSLRDLKYARTETWTIEKMLDMFRQLLGKELIGDAFSLNFGKSEVKQYRFWDTDESTSLTAPFVLAQLLSMNHSNHISTTTGHDNLVQGGVIRTDIRTVALSVPVFPMSELVDLTVVGDGKLLSEFDVLTTLKAHGSLLLKLPGMKNEDLEKKIPVGLRQGIASKGVKLFILDPSMSENVSGNAEMEPLLLQLAFLQLLDYDISWSTLDKIATINGNPKGLRALLVDMDKVLRQFEVPESWANIDLEVEKISLPTQFRINSFSRFEHVDPVTPTALETWVTAAKGLLFKEAYGTKSTLRPDVGVKTSIVHVKEHRRLTPLTYDRNIFHIEFDLGDSDLTYSIGEALGIHAENDKTEVEEFIKWYGLNPNEIIQVPSREDTDTFENRTIYQSLMQNIDIFGRPPKRFYEALSEFATDTKEKQKLLTLSLPEGAAEFKRRAEVDTVTFADVLLEFPSAHPSFHDIVRIVSPMKRREYSIASSQHVTPNSVSLLIVTVGWVDPKGRNRFGQATRYLNALRVGASVTVSVKPSVMKLPRETTAPIIMAGLGTGLAPFRAFVQERAYQKYVLGQEIGAVMLYLGSRHQREEYLYGEEWEAYLDAGVITHLGCAFSRDQSWKIYIQDRMRESMQVIRQKYLQERGSFYLCGPTWPVPDVTEVLEHAVVEEEKARGVKKVDGRRGVEELKEEGRYVLEVY
jgi:sulfite reductase (NADPH) flavoprotein alpha-component